MPMPPTIVAVMMLAAATSTAADPESGAAPEVDHPMPVCATPGTERSRRAPAISERIYRVLAKADAALRDDDPATARAALEQALHRSPGNSNEQGQLLNMLAHVHLSAEDYPAATGRLEALAALGAAVPAGLQSTTLHTLAQLYFQAERYAEAERCLGAWLAGNPDAGPEAQVFLAKIHYRRGALADATTVLEQALGDTAAAGQQAPESWQRLLLYLYMTQERAAPAIALLEHLVAEHPSREYWLQLAGLYGQQGQSERQLRTMEAAHAGGYLRQERDQLIYAQLLLQARAPVRAAWHLNQALADGEVRATAEHLETLSQAWYLAGERTAAIDALSAAAERNPTLRSRLAQLHLEAGNYDRCSEEAANARTGAGNTAGAPTTADLTLIHGICLFNLGHLAAARGAFGDALADPTLAGQARAWLRHLDAEASRRAALNW